MMVRSLGIVVAILALNLGTLRAAPETTGSLHIDSIEALSKSIAAFVKNAAPDKAAMVEAQMQQVPEMARQFGLDPSRPLGAVLLDPSDWGYALILPITDKQLIIDNPGLGLEPSADNPKNYLLKLPNLPAPALVTFEGTYALLSTNADALEQLRASAQSGAAIVPTGAPIELNLAVDKLWPALEPMAESFLEMSESKAGDKNAALLKAQAEAYFHFFRQTKSLAWRITIQPEALATSWSVEGLPGTDLEKFLKTEAGPVVDYLGALSNDGAVRGTFSIKPTPELIEVYLSWSKNYLAMLASASEKPFEAGKWEKVQRDVVTEAFQACDGGGAFSFYSGTSFGSCVYGVTDQAKAKALLARVPELQAMMMEYGELSGAKTSMKLEGTSKQGDAEIYNYTLEMEQKFDTELERETAEKAMKAMGLEKKTTTIYAVTPSKLMFAMGKDAAETIKTLVEKFTQPIPAADVTPAQFGLPANPHVFATISVPRMMRMFASISGSAAPEVIEDKPPGMAMAVVLNGKGEFSLHLTAAELKRIIAYTESIKKGAEPEEKEEAAGE